MTAEDVCICLHDQHVQRLEGLTPDEPAGSPPDEDLHGLGHKQSEDDLCPCNARQQPGL